jgi:outer membrane protein OmpA-like peptidoglycan-associated protein
MPDVNSYRRGAVMGLTAAETFMLISFMLLLLLTLWRQTEEERTAEAVDFAAAFTPSQREAALLYKEHIIDIDKALDELGEYRKLLETAGSPEAALQAAAIVESLPHLDPDTIEERARLLDKELVEHLSKAAVAMPDQTLRRLTELSELEQFPAIVDKVSEDPDEVERLREENEVMKEALAGVAAASDRASRTSAEIAAAIRERAGDLVAEFNGQILDNGNVIFPEGVLFDAGSSVIRSEFDNVLRQFCRPWFEILYDVDGSLSGVQIEGHASSEWRSLPPEQAFANNLDLSQRRAGAVFKRCLGYG